MKRNIHVFMICLLLAAMVSAGPAFAQDIGENQNMDIIKELGADQAPDKIAQGLSLPDSASGEARDNTAYGLDKANEALEQKLEQEMDPNKEKEWEDPEKPGDQLKEQLKDQMLDEDRLRDKAEDMLGVPSMPR